MGWARVDTREIVEAMLRCWAVQDVERTLSWCAESIVCVRHVPSVDGSSSGRRMFGIERLRTQMFDFLAEFCVLDYRPVICGVTEGSARLQVHFAYHHLASGELLTGSKRVLLQISDGAVVRMEIFHDGPRLRAFWSLAAWHEHLRGGLALTPPPGDWAYDCID